MRPTLAYVLSRLSFDLAQGTATWVDATKHHAPLVGKEAGCPRRTQNGKLYWHIKIDNTPFKRSHLVYLVANGRWPELQIDHIDGDSLNDKPSNLREVTATQNAWNHKVRSKKAALPMGVRLIASSGKFQARIACNKRVHYLGVFETPDQASAAYQNKRKELFGEYA